nr:RNA-directed DNA polymerase, eukaryota, reverse transcriptase zinc-binding domain protein [Tanacetum cinerariifolium]
MYTQQLKKPHCPRLPTRSELDLRGIDVDSVRCPKCDNDIETKQHVFVSCPVAVEEHYDGNGGYDHPPSTYRLEDDGDDEDRDYEYAPAAQKEMPTKKMYCVSKNIIWWSFMIYAEEHCDGSDGYDYPPSTYRLEGDNDDGDYDYAPAPLEGDGDDDDGDYDYAPTT